MRELVVVSCSSAKSNVETLLEKSLREKKISHNSYIYKENVSSICAMYNDFIDLRIDSLSEDAIVVFAHDDVYINCYDLNERLDHHLKTYDVIGVAGSETANIKKPALWHLMSDRKHHRGAVAHSINKESHEPYYVTSFGPLPARALIIDGVFIATTPKVLKKVRFDESNPARFHYYDLDFSLECNKNKFKIGVCEVPIIHISPGLSQANAEWEAGQDYFIKKWG